MLRSQAQIKNLKVFIYFCEFFLFYLFNTIKVTTAVRIVNPSGSAGSAATKPIARKCDNDQCSAQGQLSFQIATTM